MNCAGGHAKEASRFRMENNGNMVSPQCPIAVCAHIHSHDRVHPILEGGT